MIVPGFASLRPIAFFGAIAIVALVAGCRRANPNRIQGYIEGDFVYVASPLAGALDRLQVKRGDQVKAGDLLFQLECGAEKDARDEASRRLAQGRANLEDARKGKRPSEVESIEAQIKQAQAALELSESELARQEKLMRSPGVSTEQDLDRARSTRAQNQHLVAQLKADLETARLGSRPDQVAAAEANVRALEATLARAEWDLSQKQQSAPQAGVVFDTLFRQGEWVGAGKPAAVLLPPANVKLRVFVPEPWLGSLHVGDSLRVFVDGASGSVTGKVSFISPRAEYTPPVVYSQDNRNKFVFLVEAVFEPDVAATLHPGQPVDVEMVLSKP